jgi:pyruvate/2-oxoglutarate/acetoin dehydrogenase E1 component
MCALILGHAPKIDRLRRRIGNPGIPVPFEPSLEETVLPTIDKIVNVAREMMQF